MLTDSQNDLISGGSNISAAVRRMSVRSGPGPTRAGVDVTRKPRAEWKLENEAAGIGVA